MLPYLCFVNIANVNNMLRSVNQSILFFANELMKRKLLMRMRKNQPMKIWEQRAALSGNNQLSTGPPSNPRVFLLHVNNHCTSQEVDTCALIKVVPMKSWCHIWKYIKSTLHICINGENRTSKSGKIWARKKILVWNMWNYNRLSSFSFVNYRCDTLIIIIVKKLVQFILKRK